MNKILNDRNGVSTIVAAMLLLVILTTFIAALNAYYIPSLAAKSEIEHMQQAHESFMEFDSRLNLYSYIATQHPDEYSPTGKVPISLGSKGIQYFSITPSGGALVTNPQEGSMKISINYTETSGNNSIEITEQLQSTGNYRYIAFNHFWIDQELVMENGALILKQNDRSMIISSPTIIDKETGTLEINMYNITNRKQAVSGNAKYIIQFKVKNIEEHTFPANITNNITITINSKYPDAWESEFDTLRFNVTRNNNDTITAKSNEDMRIKLVYSDVAIRW